MIILVITPAEEEIPDGGVIAFVFSVVVVVRFSRIVRIIGEDILARKRILAHIEKALILHPLVAEVAAANQDQEQEKPDKTTAFLFPGRPLGLWCRLIWLYRRSLLEVLGLLVLRSLLIRLRLLIRLLVSLCRSIVLRCAADVAESGAVRQVGAAF